MVIYQIYLFFVSLFFSSSAMHRATSSAMSMPGATVTAYVCCPPSSWRLLKNWRSIRPATGPFLSSPRIISACMSRQSPRIVKMCSLPSGAVKVPVALDPNTTRQPGVSKTKSLKTCQIKGTTHAL